MNIKEILAGGSSVVAILMVLVEISPIKANPLSWLAKIVGRAINKEMMDKMDKMETQATKIEDEVLKLREEVEEKEAISCRTRILRFGDEAFHKVKHSEEHFNQILRDITTYEKYCCDHPEFENNQAVITCARIKEIYKELLVTGDFL